MIFDVNVRCILSRFWISNILDVSAASKKNTEYPCSHLSGFVAMWSVQDISSGIYTPRSRILLAGCRVMPPSV